MTEEEDTVELALTAEDMLALARAAEHARVEAGLSTALTTIDAFQPGQNGRVGRWPSTSALTVLGVAIGIAFGVPGDSVHTVIAKAAAVETVATESFEPPVRFNNPFDASEVFEFPPGTSDDNARESVATLLLERARSRQRTEADNHRHPTHGAPARARMARNSESRRTKGPAEQPLLR